MKIYLAGPEVFLPDAVEIGQAKKRLCAAYGFEGLYPFDNEIVASPAGERTDRLIYRANESLIRRADIGICDLTPFRGLSADPGTVFEVGMLAGLGKPLLGYTNVMDDFSTVSGGRNSSRSMPRTMPRMTRTAWSSKISATPTI